MTSVDWVDLVGEARQEAVPIIVESFTGVYRWHAKHTLRRVEEVRGIRDGNRLVGVSMLEQLVPGVGYVYYVAVRPSHRDQKLGGLLLDDALARFRVRAIEVVYAAVQTSNTRSHALFASRGFRTVERDEVGFREGGLGATGLRTKMMVVTGETLLGLRLTSAAPPGTAFLCR